MESSLLQKSWKRCPTILQFIPGLLSNDWVLSFLKKKVIKIDKMISKELIRFHMSLIMELFIMGNGQPMDWEMAKEFNYGMMDLYTLGIGETIRLTERVDWFMLTVMFMRAIGSAIRLKEEALMNIWMELSM